MVSVVQSPWLGSDHHLESLHLLDSPIVEAHALPGSLSPHCVSEHIIFLVKHIPKDVQIHFLSLSHLFDLLSSSIVYTC